MRRSRSTVSTRRHRWSGVLLVLGVVGVGVVLVKPDRGRTRRDSPLPETQHEPEAPSALDEPEPVPSKDPTRLDTLPEDLGSAALHERVAGLLRSAMQDPATAARLERELRTHLDRAHLDARRAALLALVVGVSRGESALARLWPSLKQAPPPVMVYVGYATSLEPARLAGLSREDLAKVVAGLLLRNETGMDFLDWRRAFFARELGEEHRPRRVPTTGPAPEDLLSMEAASLANTVLARKPTIENLQRFREVFLDPGRTMVQRIRLLNSTYLFQREHEAVQQELTTVARLARPPELRQAALRMLSHPAPASVKRELSEWALEEQDARVLSALVDALRMTNTNPGRDLLRLVGRLETPEYGLAVARLAIGMAQVGTDATVDAALQALTDRRYAHSIAALVPRLERKGFLEHATVPILDAMAVVLASGDRADVRLVLRHIATSRLPALEPAVRKISETAKEADVREAAKRALER